MALPPERPLGRGAEEDCSAHSPAQYSSHRGSFADQRSRSVTVPARGNRGPKDAGFLINVKCDRISHVGEIPVRGTQFHPPFEAQHAILLALHLDVKRPVALMVRIRITHNGCRVALVQREANLSRGPVASPTRLDLAGLGVGDLLLRLRGEGHRSERSCQQRNQ